MQSTPRERLMQFSYLLQERLFGEVEQKIGSLSEKARLLLAVLGMVPLSRCLPPTRGWRGRPAEHRLHWQQPFWPRRSTACRPHDN